MKIDSNSLSVLATGFYADNKLSHERRIAGENTFRKRLHKSLAALDTAESPEAEELVEEWTHQASTHPQDEDERDPPGYGWGV